MKFIPDSTIENLLRNELTSKSGFLKTQDYSQESDCYAGQSFVQFTRSSHRHPTVHIKILLFIFRFNSHFGTQSQIPD